MNAKCNKLFSLSYKLSVAVNFLRVFLQHFSEIKQYIKCRTSDKKVLALKLIFSKYGLTFSNTASLNKIEQNYHHTSSEGHFCETVKSDQLRKIADYLTKKKNIVFYQLLIQL